MLYPIGIIPYTNMEPYRQLGEPDHCRFVPLVPKESIGAIKCGDIIAASIPIGGLKFLEELIEPIGLFGIAAKECSMSVLFFSNIPFTSINRSHRIKLTCESSSSVKLLYLLLGYKNGFNNIPKLSNDKDKLVGELVIGDLALLMSGMLTNTPEIFLKKNKWLYVTDLAKLWYNIKGYPFVFARWVIRKDAPQIVKKSIKNWLLSFKKQENILVNKAIKVSSALLNIESSDMRLYFEVIRRSLSYDDIVGQNLFLDSFKYSDKILFWDSI